MPTLLLLLCWIAVSSTTAEEELCNPVLEIQNATMTSVTVKWWCKGNVTTKLKGFELYYGSLYTDTYELAKTLNAEQHEATITELDWRVDYGVFIEAVYRNDMNTTDRSEALVPELLRPIPCRPLLDIKPVGLDSVTLKWTCANNNSSPIDDYEIKYGRREDWYEDLKSIIMDNRKQEVTLKALTCGDMYQFNIKARRGYIIEFYDSSDTLRTIVGDLQTYPESNQFLEVGKNFVSLKLDLLTPNCPVKAFNITLKHLLRKKLINETQTEAAVKQLQLSGLAPIAEYELHVKINEGSSDAGASYTFRTLCDEENIIAPTQDQTLQVHSRHFVVQLDKWECVDSFAVEYRKSESPQWNLVSSNTKVEQKSLLIQQLSPKASYDVRITAKNKFGRTAAEYPKVQYIVQNRYGCGDWSNLGNRCVTFVKEAGLQSKNDAQLVCNRLKRSMEIPSLLTINNQNEEFQVKHYLNPSGPVWLGLHSDDGEVFSRDDGAQFEHSNWIQQLTHNKTHQCVQMLTSGVSGGSWHKVNCNTWSYVACEKSKSLTSEELTEEILTTMEQFAKRLTEAETKLKACEKN